MKDAIEVYPPGTSVDLHGTDIKGTVQTVAIFPKDVIKYEVAWWSGGDRKSDWFHQSEVTSSTEPARIGFKSVTG